MLVEEIMSSPVITVSPHTPLSEVISVLLEHRIGSSIVTATDELGIVTRSDILRAAYHLDADLDTILVADAMSTPIITVEPQISVESALRKMSDHNIKKLPILDGLELVGIVTLTDIAQHHPRQVRDISQTLDRKDDWTD